MGRQPTILCFKCDKCGEQYRVLEKHKCVEGKKMNGIQKINKIYKEVLKLTDADFEQVKEMARKQSNYIHPLKNATANRLNETGDHNTRVLKALHNLRETIKSGAL